MSSNKLSFLIEQANFDWNSTYLDVDGGSKLSFSYPLTPTDYLSFAEADLATGRIHGYVNAIANAKRAIDCQTDTVISAFGYDPTNLRQQLGKALSAKIDADASEAALPFSFKFLESIGVSTPSIVSRARLLRHHIEHRYQRPPRRRALEALEVAALFVRATERILIEFDDRFGLGCGSVNFRGDDEFEKTFHVNVHCDASPPRAVIYYWKKPFDLNKPRKSPKVEVTPHHESYYWLIRIALAFGQRLRASKVQPLVRGFVSAAKANVPISRIRVLGYK